MPPIACRSAGDPVGSLVGEDILPGCVVDADMQMQAAAGALGERLGHEGGLAAMAAATPLAIRLYITASSAARRASGTVLRVSSSWPGAYSEIAPSSGTPWASAQAHRSRRKSGEVLQLAQAIDAVQRGPLARCAARPARRRRPPCACGIDEIVFQFTGHHRRQSVGGEALQHPREHMAGIKIARRTVEFVQRGDDLGDIVSRATARGPGFPGRARRAGRRRRRPRRGRSPRNLVR